MRLCGWFVAGALALTAVHVGALAWIASATDTTFSQISLLSPDLVSASALHRYLLTPLVVGCSLLLALFIPGVPWCSVLCRGGRRLGEYVVLSAVLSVLTLAGATSAYKAIAGAPLTRVALLALIWAVIGLGLVLQLLLKRPLWLAHVGKTLRRAHLWWVAGGCAVIIGCAWLLRDKIVLENVNSDGWEALSFSRSLVHQLVPWAQFHPQIYMASPSFMLAFFPTNFMLVLLGDAPGSIRVVACAWLPLVAISLALLAEAGRQRAAPWPRMQILLLLPLAPFAIVGVFYGGWCSYFNDISEPFTINLFTLLLFNAALYMRVEGRHRWALLMVALLLLTSPSGKVIGLLVIGAHWLVARPGWKRAAREVMALGVLVGLHQLATHFYPLLFPGVEHVRDEFSGAGALRRFDGWTLASALKDLWVLLLCTGGVPVLVLALRRDRGTNYLLLCTGAYLMLVLAIADHNVHYLMPILLLPSVALVRSLVDAGDRARRSLTGAWVAGTLVALVLVMPNSRRADTRSRAFGRATCIRVDTEDGRIAATHSAFLLTNPETKGSRWVIAPEAWREYAASGDCSGKRFDYYLVHSKYLDIVPDGYQTVTTPKQLSGLLYFVFKLKVPPVYHFLARDAAKTRQLFATPVEGARGLVMSLPGGNRW